MAQIKVRVLDSPFLDAGVANTPDFLKDKQPGDELMIDRGLAAFWTKPHTKAFELLEPLPETHVKPATIQLGARQVGPNQYEIDGEIYTADEARAKLSES